MKEEAATSPNQNKKTPRLGAMAAKKRQELERFDAVRKDMQEKLRIERESLAREVAEIEARDRRRMRNEQMNRQRLIKFSLGGIVLAALIKNGRGALLVTSTELDLLSEKDGALLQQVLETAAAMAVALPGDAGTDDGKTRIDVDLPI